MTNQLNTEYSWNKHFELNYVKSYIGIKDDNGLFLVIKFSNNQIFLSGKPIIGKYCKETPTELERLITNSSMSFASKAIIIKPIHMQNDTNMRALREVIKLAYKYSRNDTEINE